MALFGGTSQSRNQQKNLVEFRAGKMTLKGNTVTADKRKGTVYIYQSDDGLTHFCWKDRKTGTVEDDLIVFPDDCEYKKVTQCKEGSRVFLLKFKTSARKLFFWMQEPKADGDDDLLWKVNESLNNPGGSGSSNGRPGGQSGNVTPTPSESEMQALISNMSQSQLMQLIGGMSDLGSASGILSHLTQQIGGGLGGTGSSSSSSESKPAAGIQPAAATTTTSAPAAAASPTNASATVAPTVPKVVENQGKSGSSKAPSSQTVPIQLQDLQKILSNITPSSASAVDLSASVNGELIRRITSCPSTVKKLAPLLPQFGGPEVDLPKSEEEGSCKREVEETLLSPQFQNALSAFCAAFPTGQLAPLVSQFGMGSEAVNAAQTGNLEAFLNAIQKEAGNGAIEASGAPTETEDMNVD